MLHLLNIEIADMEVEDLRKKVQTGTSPLLLLSKGGAKRETLDQIIQQFEATQKAESLNVTRLIAGLIFTNQADQDWIERRFATMHDFLLENSWTYRQSVEQNIEKGIRESIERVVQVRFPMLTQLLKKRIEHIHDQEILLQVLVAMSTAETEQRARRYLLALENKKE